MMKGKGRLRAALCFCCALMIMLLAVSAVAGEADVWEERLKQAREKYNSKTVNVFVRRYGYNQRGKINICFYPSKDRSFMTIEIEDSLKISEEAEMQAILEVVAKNEHYSEEEYGTISFMKAQWITHNIAFSLATGSEEDRELIELLTGENVSKIVGHAKELDLSPLRTMTDKEIMLYRIVEYSFCHP